MPEVRPHDAVRHVVEVVGGAGFWPANIGTTYGYFYRAYIDGGVRVRRSHIIPPFETNILVVSGAGYERPFLYEDHQGYLHLAYSNDDGVYKTRSFDRANTWETPTLDIAGGKWPIVIGHKQWGPLLIAALVGSNINAKLRFPTGAEQSFSFASSSATLLFDVDDTFCLYWHDFELNRIIGSFHIDGESSISEWFSTDFGKTWTRVS